MGTIHFNFATIHKSSGDLYSYILALLYTSSIVYISESPLSSATVFEPSWQYHQGHTVGKLPFI
jgi:hypothetical protein